MVAPVAWGEGAAWFGYNSLMPTVMQIGRYRFFFFSNENREPAHVHIKAASDEAKFWLEPVVLAVNHGFRAHDLNEIERLVDRAPGNVCGGLE